MLSVSEIVAKTEAMFDLFNHHFYKDELTCPAITVSPDCGAEPTAGAACMKSGRPAARRIGKSTSAPSTSTDPSAKWRRPCFTKCFTSTKIMFEEGILPKVWPEARTRKTRKAKSEEVPIPEKTTSGLQAALELAEAEGQPVAEIAEAAAQGAEITAELNGQELTITAHEPETMEAAFNVTGERRKTLVEAVKAFVDAPAVYQNAPSFAYVIGDYTVSKIGTVSGPANEALMVALNAKGFIIE